MVLAADEILLQYKGPGTHIAVLPFEQLDVGYFKSCFETTEKQCVCRCRPEINMGPRLLGHDMKICVVCGGE